MKNTIVVLSLMMLSTTSFAGNVLVETQTNGSYTLEEVSRSNSFTKIKVTINQAPSAQEGKKCRISFSNSSYQGNFAGSFKKVLLVDGNTFTTLSDSRHWVKATNEGANISVKLKKCK